MRPTTFLSTIAVGLSAACGSTPPPQVPAPEPAAVDMAMQRHVQDSLSAVNRARADSAERALANRARADSVERVRLAAEGAAAVVAAKNTELRRELSVMVHFDLARSQIRPDDGAALDRKVAILNANPEVRLRITGATDDRGSDAYNQALGNRRANAVKRYLVDKGIDAARLNETSTGESAPLDADRGEAAWARNRRAEFVIVSADRPLAMKE